jgi:hypothetical protein
VQIAETRQKLIEQELMVRTLKMMLIELQWSDFDFEEKIKSNCETILVKMVCELLKSVKKLRDGTIFVYNSEYTKTLLSLESWKF